MQKWEYLILFTDGTRVTHVQGTPLPHPHPFFWDFLNQLGNEGWELVSATPGEMMKVRTTPGLLYLKRQK
jgi:hypothetical protein